MKKNILEKENGVIYKLDKGKLYIEKNGRISLIINLQIEVDGNRYKFTNILEEKENYYLLGANGSDANAVIEIEDGNVSFQICNYSEYIEKLGYFSNSYCDSSMMKTFSSDSHANQVDFESTWATISSYASPTYEEELNINRTWYLTPQQRAFSIRLHELTADEKPWFGVSMPGPLSVFETKFGLRFKTFKLLFEKVYPNKMDNKLPKVYFIDSLENEYNILEHHYNLTKKIGFVNEQPYYDWWSKPMVTASGDIAIKMMRSAELKGTDTIEDLLEYIEVLEEKTGIKDFTFIVEGYWFENVGNYLEVADVLGAAKFREFVDKCHEMGHKVVLWFSHFKAGLKLPDCIDESMVIDSGVPTAPDNGSLLFNHNTEGVKSYFYRTLKFLLSSEEGCLNADGLKNDLAYIIPKPTDEDKTNGNSIGDQLRYEVSKYIYEYSHSIKEDALITDTTSEAYIKCDAIRLNDEYGEGVSAWVDRAKRCSYVKNRLIDTDGMFMDSQKFKNYCMLAPAIGIPCFYTVHKFFHLEDVLEHDYKRLASAWETYSKCPVTPDMDIIIDVENNFYGRKYTSGEKKGEYSAISIEGKCLVAYCANKIYVSSVMDKFVEIPVSLKSDEDILIDVIPWKGEKYTYSGIYSKTDKGVLLKVEDCSGEIKRLEISIR